MTDKEIETWQLDVYADIMEKLSFAHELLTRVTGTPLAMYDQELARDITQYLKLNKDITTYLNNTRKL